MPMHWEPPQVDEWARYLNPSLSFPTLLCLLILLSLSVHLYHTIISPYKCLNMYVEKPLFSQFRLGRSLPVFNAT